MIGSAILAKAYRLTNRNSATFLDANSTNIYADLNTCYGQRILDILRVRVDKNATINNVYIDLLSTVGIAEGSNGYNGEYAFPTDLLKPTRFEVSYDGVNWKKCKIYDNALNQGSEFNNAQLANDFSDESPCVDFTRNSYKIRPPKTTSGNVTNGIYIEYEQRQDDFTDSTAPSQIEANLQEILAWDLASLEMVMHSDKYSQKQVSIFNAEKAKVEQRFLEFYMSNLPTKKIMTFNFASLPR